MNTRLVLEPTRPSNNDPIGIALAYRKLLRDNYREISGEASRPQEICIPKPPLAYQFLNYVTEEGVSLEQLQGHRRTPSDHK